MKKYISFCAALVIISQIGTGTAFAVGYRCVFDKEGYYTTIKEDGISSERAMHNKNIEDTVINFETNGKIAVSIGRSGSGEAAVISNNQLEHFIEDTGSGLVTYTIFKDVEQGKNAFGQPVYAAATSRHIDILGIASIGQYFGTCSPTSSPAQ